MPRVCAASPVSRAAPVVVSRGGDRLSPVAGFDCMLHRYRIGLLWRGGPVTVAVLAEYGVMTLGARP